MQAIYDTPLLELVFRAASVHRTYHDPRQVQKCTLLSIKTGGCPEDCNYCSQSSKHSESTGTKATKLMDLEEVYEAAIRAKESGSTRFCMGAAWRGPSQVQRHSSVQVFNNDARKPSAHTACFSKVPAILSIPQPFIRSSGV